MADEINTVELATELTIAWLGNSNTRVHADDVPAFLAQMHAAVAALSSPATASQPEEASGEVHAPAVSVRKSLGSKDHIISMIDGKPYKTLKRHLSGHGLTPETYRKRFNLKADYPMVAETYSEARRSMAKTIGLGRKKVEAAVEAVAEPVKAAVKRGRKSAAAAKSAAAEHLGGSNDG